MAPPSFPSPLPPRPLLPFLLTKCVTRCVLLCEQARARASSEGPKRTRGRVCARATREPLLSFPFPPSPHSSVSPPSPAASVRGRPAFLLPRGCRRRRRRLRATTAAPTRRAGGRASEFADGDGGGRGCGGGRPPLVALRPPFEQGGRPARASQERRSGREREEDSSPSPFPCFIYPPLALLSSQASKRESG